MTARKWKVGDRVRLLQTYNPDSYPGMTKGNLFTVSFVFDNGNVKLEEQNSAYIWKPNWFEPADEIRVELGGKIVTRDRDTDTVSFLTSDGKTLLLPASLFPEDPDLILARELVASFYRHNINLSTSYADLIERGSRDEHLQHIVAKIKELKNG